MPAIAFTSSVVGGKLTQGFVLNCTMDSEVLYVSITAENPVIDTETTTATLNKSCHTVF